MTPERQINWKFWLAVVVLAGAVVFAGWRLHDALSNRPGLWSYMESRVGPTLKKGAKPDLPWNQFRRLLDEAKCDAADRRFPLGSIHFLELQRTGKDAVVWTTDNLINYGFNPLSHFERSLGGDPARIIGYYTLDGAAIPFTLKKHPARPKTMAVTISMREPVPPSSSQLVIRVERQPSPVRIGKTTGYDLGFGRLPKSTTAVHARGARLPEGATLTSFTHTNTAIVSTAGVPMVGWINTRLAPAGPPLSLSFTQPK